MKKIAVLGSTGSIGRQSLEVIRRHPDAFAVDVLAAQSNAELLLEQAWTYRPSLVALVEEDAASQIKGQLPPDTRLVTGEDSLIAGCNSVSTDIVLIATMGFSGLAPLIECIRNGKRIALANKESIVCGGELVQQLLREHSQRIYPVDSEHSGVFQCLQGIQRKELKRILLTASGGPFRTLPADQFQNITAAQALKHPRWSMGPKITVDSASLMNKGFEIMEACWLFDMPIGAIDVLIHPESIVHALIETVDGCVLAQLGAHDMRAAIQYALSFPARMESGIAPLDLSEWGALHFEKPDTGRFPCLRLAYDAMHAGGVMPVVLNAANEVAVGWFLQGKLPFTGIPATIEAAMERVDNVLKPCLQDIYDTDAWTREMLNHTKLPT